MALGIILHKLFKNVRETIMNSCSNLFYLSAIACQLSECLSEKEMATLAADLVVLSDMLANIITHKETCLEKCRNNIDMKEKYS